MQFGGVDGDEGVGGMRAYERLYGGYSRAAHDYQRKSAGSYFPNTPASF